MIKLNNKQLLLFTSRKKDLIEWKEFKTKWDGNIPRKNSFEFAEYVEDASIVTKKVQEIVDEIILEIADEIIQNEN